MIANEIMGYLITAFTFIALGYCAFTDITAEDKTRKYKRFGEISARDRE